jgi:hypothetical protein
MRIDEVFSLLHPELVEGSKAFTIRLLIPQKKAAFPRGKTAFVHFQNHYSDMPLGEVLSDEAFSAKDSFDGGRNSLINGLTSSIKPAQVSLLMYSTTASILPVCS